MLSDPDLASFIQHPEVNAWLGPGRHLVAYCVVSIDLTLSNYCQKAVIERRQRVQCSYSSP